MKRTTGAMLLATVMFLSAGTARADWYVDNAAAGANNGTSWTNAWRSLADIRFGPGGVMPGDVLYISGGTDLKTYHGMLWVQFPFSNPRITGTADQPVAIKVGREPGHNGTVVITNDGVTDHDGYAGIYIQSEDYISVDGHVNGERRIKVMDGSGAGIMAAGSCHVTLTWLEVAHNGDEAGEDGINITDGNDSVFCAEISHCSIHDNYQDQIHLYSGQTRYGRFLVHDNEIFNLNDDGIECGRGVDFYNNDVRGLAVTGTAGGHPDGIQTGGGYCRIYNNTFHDFYNPSKEFNAAMEISFFNANHDPESYFEIYNNVVVQNQNGDASTMIRGLEFTRSTLESGIVTDISGVVIANNTFIDVPFFGLGIFLNEFAGRHTTAHNITVVNNIVHNCGRYGNGIAAVLVNTDSAAPPVFGSWGDTADMIIDHNIVSAGTEGNCVVNQNGQTYGSNTAWSAAVGVQKHISGNPDPLLDGLLKPRVNSPARDAGAELADIFAVDKDGMSRPQGAAWDIGAYEFVSGLSLTSPTGDEIWVQGFGHDIKWSSSGVTEPVKIELFKDSALQWNVTVPVTNGSYTWPIPNGQIPGSDYTIKISAGSYSDTSDPFTIVAPAAPVVQTQAAQSVTASSASLRGTVHPMGLATTYYFEYGLTTAYGFQTAEATLAAGDETTTVPAAISNLNASTIYHFRLVANNNIGTSEGDDMTFTTSGGGGGGGGDSGGGGGGGGGGCFIAAAKGVSLWFMVPGLVAGWLIWIRGRAKPLERRA